MRNSGTFRYLPLIVFAVVYALSCVLGAVLIIAGYDPFIALFEYFSGTHVPSLTSAQRTTDLLLLIVAPLLLCAGYAAVTEFRRPRGRTDDTANTREDHPVAAQIVFWILAGGGIASLAAGGALGRAHSWLDYGSWIHARAANFQNLTFAEFVNLYVLVPTAAAWVVVATPSDTILRKLARWVPPAIAVLFTLLLYMRKAAIVVILLVAFAWMIDLRQRRRRGMPYLVAGTVIAVGVLYFAVVVAPVYSKASHAVAQAHAATATTPAAHSDATVTKPQLKALGKKVGFHTRRESLLIYALASPLTRSSAPALWYPVIFPTHHPYFHLDVGVDILGVGTMPDDNIVVWNYLNPNLPGGTEMVPYQFVLYSQGGTAMAIGLSLLVGALLALLWRGTQALRVPAPWNALLGGLTMLLAVYIALDSLRNSTLVSYGVIWGFLFVGVAIVVTRIASRFVGARPSFAGPTLTYDRAQTSSKTSSSRSA
jgi:hypothetical protein